MKTLPKRTRLGQEILDAACRWIAEHGVYGIGDCYYTYPLNNLYETLPRHSVHQIDGALAKLQRDGLFCDNCVEWEGSYGYESSNLFGLEPMGWLAWSDWRDEMLLEEIYNTECGQDWPDLEELARLGVNPDVIAKID